MEDIDKCPCIDCICIPVCRNREYWQLFKNCSLIEEYIPNYGSHITRDYQKVMKLQSILNPPTWEYKGDGLVHMLYDNPKTIIKEVT